MHVVVWRSGDLTCATESRQVVEVIERAAPQPLAHCPDWLEGLINYRGVWLPLVSIGALLNQRPNQPRLANRILITSGKAGQLGLLVDQVDGSKTVSPNETDEYDTWRSTHHSFLGPVVTEESGTIQLIDPQGIDVAGFVDKRDQ